EAGLAEIELRQDLAHDVIDAGILQPDRVEHAGRGFPDAVGRITEPRRGRRALEHDRADVPIGETRDARVFLAEPHAARKEHHGRAQLEPAEIHGKAAHFVSRCERDGLDYLTPHARIMPPHAARDPVSAGDPAEYRQYHSALREYRHGAAPRAPARLHARGSTLAPRRARLPRARVGHGAREPRRLPRTARSHARVSAH